MHSIDMMDLAAVCGRGSSGAPASGSSSGGAPTSSSPADNITCSVGVPSGVTCSSTLSNWGAAIREAYVAAVEAATDALCTATGNC